MLCDGIGDYHLAAGDDRAMRCQPQCGRASRCTPPRAVVTLLDADHISAGTAPLAPIEFKPCRSTISGSRRVAYYRDPRRQAGTHHDVLGAPTEGMSSGCVPSTASVTMMCPCSSRKVAPKAFRPLMWRSIGRCLCRNRPGKIPEPPHFAQHQYRGIWKTSLAASTLIDLCCR